MIKLNSQMELTKAESFEETLTKDTRALMPMLCTAMAHCMKDRHLLEPAVMAGDMITDKRCFDLFKQLISAMDNIDQHPLEDQSLD